MYNVTLSNRDCIFDQMSGFATVPDALEWAAGRSGMYVIQIDNGADGVNFECVSISADDTADGPTQYKYYTLGGWQPISAAQLAAMI